MTDLEITKLCAEAMGVDFSKGYATLMCMECDEYGITYAPLHDDAQAMALVKKFKLWIEQWEDGTCSVFGKRKMMDADSSDLNRAICECVAKMQAAKARAVA